VFDHLPQKRRRVLKALIAGAVAFFVAPFAYAIDKYLSYNGFGLSGASAKVSKADLSSVGSSMILEIVGEPVIVVHEEVEGLRAFTATCTHMGCIVRYRPDQKDFYCKCHHGRFDKDGVNVPGTKPPSPLTELVVKPTGNEIEIVLTAKHTTAS
jgi:Rieske Fe-S protein